ncbi:MAG: beta-lactamase family protein [Proteobacteria bacterium]|nr:beta-lactamase family protein [Pseudomonadota bacterium]MBU4471272.1 beta-lactamase family protein [Pseudomonadota bacterium]MCG2753892.1 beta-lactamase family protein [Desulfobacteraceae bacterium]
MPEISKDKTNEQKSLQKRPGMNTRRHVRALAAGYKALYYASGIFTAGHTTERIEADVFVGTSPLWEKLFPEFPAEIDEKNKTVAVTYLQDMSPRIAAWRPGMGSTLMPLGATMDAIQYLPRFSEDLVLPDTDDLPWPRGDKDAVAFLPAAQQEALDQLVKKAFDEKIYGGKTWGVIIVKDRKIIGERYAEDMGYDMHTPHRTNSAAKSFAVSVIGAAVQQGLLDIHQKGILSEWRQYGDPRGEITLNDLLHMCSGLYTERSGDPQQEMYYGGAAAADKAVRSSFEYLPGKRWLYAGSDTICAVRTLREALGDDARYHQFPYRELFWKLGMTRTIVETDWKGDFLMSGQCWSTARDFARFGLLYLNDGVWNGERILPEGWAKYVATPGPDQPVFPDGRGYGAQFWLYGPKQGLPEGVFTADGARGQWAMIIPSENMVIVRRGHDHFNPSDGHEQEGFQLTRFAADILAALK